ncbi:Phytolongin Phyl2.1 [Bienertia sinuspersici]
MFADPDLVRYACIAHHPSFESSTILAEFNSADSNLQQLAKRCLQVVPPHHKVFSHSYRNQSYTFLLHDRFVYFGIFDSNMVKSDQIRFLSRLKETIDHLIINGKSNFKFSSYCLQGELHPIFHRLMSKSFDFDTSSLLPNGVHNNNTPVSNSSKNKKILSVSLLSPTKIGKGFKKKKMSEESMTNSRDALVDGKVDGSHDDNEVKSREIIHTNDNFFMDSGVGRHKAKKIWRRHVWIVLVLDLAVCLILFGIWLFVCRGFQCIGG